MKILLIAAAALTLGTTPVFAQKRTSVSPRAMQILTPALADYTDTVLFGDVWRELSLSPRDRSMVTLSVLVATGKAAQLTPHVELALRNSVTPREISGLITQLAFYTGWPNAVSSLEVIEKVYTDKKINITPLKIIPTIDNKPPNFGAFPDKLLDDQVAQVAPHLAQITRNVILDDLWLRNDLSPRDRSLITIAALTSMGDSASLVFHLKLGLQNGLTQTEIGAALTQIAFYAGLPRAEAAVVIATKIFGADRSMMTASDGHIQITRPDTSPRTAPATSITGSATISSSINSSEAAALKGATVTFQPGARTLWHTHPLGQLLIVTQGTGWIQAAGEPVRVIHAGDSVWIPPNVRHWHGATRTTGMTHVGIAIPENGSTVTWLEPVNDADYHGPP